MPKNPEQYAADFTQLVNDKFASDDPLLYLDEFDTSEEYESSHQSLNLVAKTALSLCPAFNLKTCVARPNPNLAFARPEIWHNFDVYYVRVEEYYANQSRVQTDFYVKTGQILMRRMVTFSDEYNFLPGETKDEYLYRQTERLIKDTLHLLTTPGDELDERTHGRALTSDESVELLSWIRDATVAQGNS